MEFRELTIKKREGTGKEVAKRLRRQGLVPAVLYGGGAPQTLTVDYRDVIKVIQGREGSTTLLPLKFEAGGGVRDRPGIPETILREVQVSCLPGLIPERITVDVSALMIGDVLTVANLAPPEGVKILNDPGQAVVTVSPPMAEEVAAPAAVAAEVAPTEPEVLTKRKPKPEEVEAAEAKPESKKEAKK